MDNQTGNINDLRKMADQQGGSNYEDLQMLLAVLKNVIDEDDIAVVYPRNPFIEDDMGSRITLLELVVFARDGRIIVASTLAGDRFEIHITNKSEVSGLNVSGFLSTDTIEMMPKLTINLKDGSQIELDSEEDGNEYWGENYPELMKLIIRQLNS